jgi:hypothetical protein
MSGSSRRVTAYMEVGHLDGGTDFLEDDYCRDARKSVLQYVFVRVACFKLAWW